MSTLATASSAHQYLRSQTRWHWLEIVFWLSLLLPYVLTPNYLVLASQIAITALFALSLDLILGYAGIVSLGHAAFFGFGAYTAGIISKPWLMSFHLYVVDFQIPWPGWANRCRAS